MTNVLLRSKDHSAEFPADAFNTECAGFLSGFSSVNLNPCITCGRGDAEITLTSVLFSIAVSPLYNVFRLLLHSGYFSEGKGSLTFYYLYICITSVT